jgi:hypothetical protein
MEKTSMNVVKLNLKEIQKIFGGQFSIEKDRNEDIEWLRRDVTQGVTCVPEICSCFDIECQKREIRREKIRKVRGCSGSND